jgi:hypothetical protein
MGLPPYKVKRRRTDTTSAWVAHRSPTLTAEAAQRNVPVTSFGPNNLGLNDPRRDGQDGVA